MPKKEYPNYTEADFSARVRQAGGRAFLVGGYVRDLCRQAQAKDRDYVICGLTVQQLERVFPEAKRVGKSFPVYLLQIDAEVCEVSLARKERKIASGYTGFAVSTDASITIEEDLLRRDTRMNAMALELPERTMVDPYGGQQDIAERIIRPVSEHFTEDPVRALRAARQAAELEFALAEETILMMRACRDELRQESEDRFRGELTRALAVKRPSVFFRALAAAELLEVTLPEIFALIGQTQPVQWHPEGDAFEHTMQVVDEVSAVSDNLVCRFAALAHDLGKGTTPKEMLPHHYDHELRGLEVLDGWKGRGTLPKVWVEAAKFVIEHHMHACRLKKPGKIVKLLLALRHVPLTTEDFCHILRADHSEPPFYLLHADELLEELLQVSGKEAPEDLPGEAIGQWIEARRIRVLQQFCQAKAVSYG